MYIYTYKSIYTYIKVYICINTHNSLPKKLPCPMKMGENDKY